MWVETGQRHIDEIQLAYAAGYLDGEGCFQYCNTPKVSIINCYPKTLIWFKGMFKGTFKKRMRSNHKDQWRATYEWRDYGDNSRNCVSLCLPYLQEKQNQARILLEISKYPPKSTKRAELKKELSLLKKIDYRNYR